jgi:hypothetical protein
VWNSLAVLGWVWAFPLFLLSKDRLPLLSRQLVFSIIWIVPGLVAQAVIHVDAPGHTLFSVPAFCLLGAYVLRTGLQRYSAADCGLFVASVASVLFFMNFVPLPPPGSPGGVRDAFAVATFESSLEGIRWLDDIHGSSLKEIHDLTPADRRVVIIAQGRRPAVELVPELENRPLLPAGGRHSRRRCAEEAGGNDGGARQEIRDRQHGFARGYCGPGSLPYPMAC